MAHLVKIYSKDACPYCVMAESKAAQLKESGDIKDYVVYKLNKDFGTWKTPWGEFNRYQRNDKCKQC